MAAELSHIGLEEPINHKPAHDLESFFYILVGMCLLFQVLKTLQSDEELTVCFDLLFAVFKPTLQKTLVIQSDFGWTMLILPNIALYFQPIIPLLTFICEEFILSIKMDNNGGFRSKPKCTHNTFLTAITSTLVTLQATHWETPHEVNCLPRKAVPPKSAYEPLKRS